MIVIAPIFFALYGGQKEKLIEPFRNKSCFGDKFDYNSFNRKGCRDIGDNLK
jgi:hypothetical protein